MKHTYGSHRHSRSSAYSGAVRPVGRRGAVIGLLVLLAGLLVKKYIFPEDSHLEIWLVKGPFACGKRTHKHFVYQQEVHTVPLKDPTGLPNPVAHTRHIYDNTA